MVLLFGHQDNISAEKTILIRKTTVSTVLIRNAANGLDANAVTLTFGGLEYTVVFFDYPIKSIFHCQQKHMLGI